MLANLEKAKELGIKVEEIYNFNIKLKNKNN